MAGKVKVTMSLDEDAVSMMDLYAKELHLSRSAFVGLMVTQISQVLQLSGGGRGPAMSNSNAGESQICNSGHD